MLLITLLVVIFGVVVPGLLTGWMVHVHGRNFIWGLLAGMLFGPAGTLGALAFILATDPRHRRGRHRHEPHRSFHPFYTVPLVGRLHVTTAWSLAGVAAFLCAWMIGGLGYELYAAKFGRGGTDAGRAAKLEANQRRGAAPANVAPSRLQDSPKPAPPAQGNHATPAAGQMVSGLAAHAANTGPAPLPAAAATAGETPSNTPPAGLVAEAAPAPSATAPPPPVASPPAPARPPAQAREAAVSEIIRGLAAGGHKVHVAVSGDAQTATLSVSGPTLTRQAGNQLLARARQTLKAAGIRIVVMNNGPESWTYIL